MPISQNWEAILHSNLKIYSKAKIYLVRKLNKFYDDVYIVPLSSQSVENKDGQPTKAYWMCAGFIFTTGDFVRDVVLHPDIYFNGEEDYLTYVS